MYDLLDDMGRRFDGTCIKIDGSFRKLDALRVGEGGRLEAYLCSGERANSEDNDIQTHVGSVGWRKTPDGSLIYLFRSPIRQYRQGLTLKNLSAFYEPRGCVYLATKMLTSDQLEKVLNAPKYKGLKESLFSNIERTGKGVVLTDELAVSKDFRVYYTTLHVGKLLQDGSLEYKVDFETESSEIHALQGMISRAWESVA